MNYIVLIIEYRPDSNSYLMIKEIPQQIEQHYYLSLFSDPCSRSIKINDTEILFCTLQPALCKPNNRRCIYTMGFPAPAYTSAIVHTDEHM